MDYSYHHPVMLQECIEGLNIKPDGIYVDVTFGGGGHSIEILKYLTTGHLYAFDQDPDAKEQSLKIGSDNFTFIEDNFRSLSTALNSLGADKVDGILADLGISSHQIDTPERGFSTRFQADLDMRMDQKSELTAADILNSYSEKELHKIFGMYGELKNARTVARTIVLKRGEAAIEDIEGLKNSLADLAPRGRENKFYAQVFQALRIEVNDEIKVLEDFLLQTADILNPGGRLVVMSYHSLEDRPVKNFFRTGKIFGAVEKDFYGNPIRPLESVTRKPITASPEEIEENPRARSAKLRIAEKAIK